MRRAVAGGHADGYRRFNTHRALGGGALLCAVVGVIAIFYGYGRTVFDYGRHAYYGLAMIGLTIIQIFLRGGPTHRVEHEVEETEVQRVAGNTEAAVGHGAEHDHQVLDAAASVDLLGSESSKLSLLGLRGF